MDNFVNNSSLVIWAGLERNSLEVGTVSLTTHSTLNTHFRSHLFVGVMLSSVTFYTVLVSLLARIYSIPASNAVFPAEGDRCTTIVIGAAASTTGGPMTTHTADCSDCDFRINKVPARDWPENTLRPLYVYKGNYPATITPNRGLTWHPDNLEGTKEQLESWGKESVITGYIPQVRRSLMCFHGPVKCSNST